MSFEFGLVSLNLVLNQVPGPIKKFQRKIWPIKSVTWPFLASLFGQYSSVESKKNLKDEVQVYA